MVLLRQPKPTGKFLRITLRMGHLTSYEAENQHEQGVFHVLPKGDFSDHVVEYVRYVQVSLAIAAYV